MDKPVERGLFFASSKSLLATTSSSLKTTGPPVVEKSRGFVSGMCNSTLSSTRFPLRDFGALG